MAFDFPDTFDLYKTVRDNVRKEHGDRDAYGRDVDTVIDSMTNTELLREFDLVIADYHEDLYQKLNALSDKFYALDLEVNRLQEPENS